MRQQGWRRQRQQGRCHVVWRSAALGEENEEEGEGEERDLAAGKQGSQVGWLWVHMRVLCHEGRGGRRGGGRGRGRGRG